VKFKFKVSFQLNAIRSPQTHHFLKIDQFISVVLVSLMDKRHICNVTGLSDD